MSSLWVNNATFKMNKINKPSPANKKVFVQKPLSHPNKNLYLLIKRIFLFISRSECRRMQGSMTIEAAVLLPLFVFMLLHLTSILEMLRLHGKLEAALWNSGNQMALYSDTLQETVEQIPDVGISWLLVHNQVTAFMGRDYLESSPLANGAEGLNYIRSDYLNEEDCVDIFVTYQVKPQITVLPFSYRRMSNRYYARAWTGYPVNSDVRYVYITPKGEAWHDTPDCSYLFHQIISVPSKQIEGRKNAQGKQYTKCEFCGEQPCKINVFVTEEGERYHMLRECTAIYKNIIAVEWTEDLPYRACSRCSA